MQLENNNTENNQNKDEHHKNEHPFLELIKFFLLAFIIVAPIRIFIAQPFIVSGASMSPTFETGHYLIVDEISYRFNEPQRGDVIILKYPKNPKKYFIKRIIGLPEETITIQDGKVSITSLNNPVPQIIDEPYVVSHKKETTRLTLKTDEYFVMGDNRSASLDSRSWGPLPANMVIGKAFIRLFPIKQAGLFPGNSE